MSRAERKLSKALFGEQPVFKYDTLINETINLLSENVNSKFEFDELLNELFDDPTSYSSIGLLNKIILELHEDRIINVEYVDGGYMQQEVKLISISGHGIKLIKLTPFLFKNKPYTFAKFTRLADLVFLKMSPILLSIIAIIVSVATCKRTH